MTDDTTTFIYFKKTGEIGDNEGKNSTVFKAKDEQLGDELVIKKIEKKRFKTKEYFSESNMLYASKHSNIVEIQYASQDDEYIYLAMPYYKKGSLNSIAKNRFLSLREIIKYSLDLLSGVNYIHSKGLLHLDIKPSNILLDATGRAVLADFGLARYTDNNGIADQPYAYTHHRDPESLQNSARTVQSDIYQIGLTMYRLCNGIDILQKQIIAQNITDSKSFETAVKNAKFPDRRFFLPHVPKKLQKIILTALNSDTNKRYGNTIEMMNEISVLDCNLDWVYTGDAGSPYYKQIDNYIINIEVSSDKSIICTKTNLTTGKKTKIHKYCIKSNLKKEEIEKKLSFIIQDIG